MSRQDRVQSLSCVYHVILRGVNKLQVFEDDDDYAKFTSILLKQTQFQNDTTNSSSPRCYIYAYCLMGNHVHMLVKGGSESIGDTVKRIATSYVYHYNHKYERVGHLFQERFKSQPVGEWSYFLTLLRYIHQNPLKGNIVDFISDYPWSCWMEYIGKVPRPFCSTSVVLGRIAFDELSQLVETPLTEEHESDFIDIDVLPNLTKCTDDEVWKLLETLSEASNATMFRSLPYSQQKQYLYAAHETGIRPRTLSRLTVIPYSIVQRATSGDSVNFTTSMCACKLEDE